jgi:hypothetical protein
VHNLPVVVLKLFIHEIIRVVKNQGSRLPRLRRTRAIALAALIGCLAGISISGKAEVQTPSGDNRRLVVDVAPRALAVFEKVPAQVKRDLFHGPSRQEQALSSRERRPASSSDQPVDSPILPAPSASGATPAEVPVLIGILITENMRAAYFLDGGAGRTLAEGDSIGDRFRVVRIEPRRVLLRDLATGLFQTIDWSDDQ